MSLPKIGALLLLCCSCQFVFGATVSQEREELGSLQRNLSKQEDKLSNLQAELGNLPATLAKAQAEFDKMEGEYAPEKEAFTKVKVEHTTSPSASTERQLKLAEIKFGLAERRYEKAKEELAQLKNRETTLHREIASTEAAISNSRAQVSQQERRLADAIETAERQEREAAIAKEEQERKERLAIAAPKIVPPKAEINLPDPEPTPDVSAPVQSNVVKLTATEIKELEFAKEKMAELDVLLAEAPSSSLRQENIVLSGSNFDDIPFKHIGNNQYRTDVTLHSGKHSFRIDDLRFRVTVPGKYEAGQVYVFLVDASDRNRFKASYFRKQLLDYFDKEISLVEPEMTFAQKVAEAGIVETAEGIFMSEDEFEEFEFAKEKMAEFNQAIAEAPADDKPKEDSLLLRNSELGDIAFEFMGNEQYRADTSLPPGRHVFRVDRLRFIVEVPESNDTQDYIFLVDARDKLTTSYFRRTLLEYADKKVAVAQ